MAVLGNVFFSTFVLCFFGQEIATDFENIFDSIYAMPWHLMSANVSKKLPTVMAMARKPINLRGYFTIECNHVFFYTVNESQSLKLFTSVYFHLFLHILGC